MSGSRAALRAGLIGGVAIGLAVVAQQTSDSPELRLLGLVITFAGLSCVGLFAARDAGDLERGPAMRAGAAGGVVAGLVAALAVIALLLVLSLNGEFGQRVEEAMQQLYEPSQVQQFEELGLTVPLVAQVTAIVQMTCCGVGLPLTGLFFGMLGGSMAASLYRRE